MVCCYLFIFVSLGKWLFYCVVDAMLYFSVLCGEWQVAKKWQKSGKAKKKKVKKMLDQKHENDGYM
jgi:hypothetical protein